MNLAGPRVVQSSARFTLKTSFYLPAAGDIDLDLFGGNFGHTAGAAKP